MGFNYVDDGSLIPNFSQNAEKTTQPQTQPTNQQQKPQKRKNLPQTTQGKTKHNPQTTANTPILPSFVTHLMQAYPE